MPPATVDEETIAKIWREVLQLQQVGIHDNFFDLGGHSLLAIQVVSRMREAFHTDVPLRLLFASPSIARLAVDIRGRRGEGSEPAEMADLVSELEGLSDQEARRLLDDVDPEGSVS